MELDSQREFVVWLRKLKQGSVSTWRGGMGREMRGRFKREGIYVYLWLIHVELLQKTTKFCKAIILQLKKKTNKKGEKKTFSESEKTTYRIVDNICKSYNC